MPQHRIEMGLDIGMRFDPRPRWERERKPQRRDTFERLGPFGLPAEEELGGERDIEEPDDEG